MSIVLYYVGVSKSAWKAWKSSQVKSSQVDLTWLENQVSNHWSDLTWLENQVRDQSSDLTWLENQVSNCWLEHDLRIVCFDNISIYPFNTVIWPITTSNSPFINNRDCLSTPRTFPDGIQSHNMEEARSDNWLCGYGVCTIATVSDLVTMLGK